MFFIRLVIAGLIVMWAPLAARAQVQYVQICSGSSFLIPGTNNCVDANQITANEYSLAREYSAALTGIAMATALVDPFVPDHANYGISVHGAWFENKSALGIAALMRLQGNLMLSAGLALADDQGSVVLTESYQTSTGRQTPGLSWDQFVVLGRLGLTYSW